MTLSCQYLCPTARRAGRLHPVLVNVDEGLWENIIGNSDPDSESSDDYTFNREKVNEFRRRLLEAPVMDGKSIPDKLTGQDNDDIDEEPEGGFDNNRYSSYWNTDTNMTHPLILARIPVTGRGKYSCTCHSATGTTVLQPPN